MALVLSGLYYTKDHEWLKIDGAVGVIGITDYAQSSLGDIVFVELPEQGQHLQEGKAFGVVESIKSVSDLYAPISGKVLERNESLLNSPELCNMNCYENWMLKIDINSQDVTHNKHLLSAQEYEAFLKTIH
jgi:glycine cleavage system H protein